MAAIDHLVYFVPDLDAGVDDAETTYGHRAEFGGRHEGRGTHNALLSLGDCYLELIAPDPTQPEPPGPRPFGIDALDRPRFVSFAVRPSPPESLDDLIDSIRHVGIDPGDAVPMSRSTPDGGELRWTLTFPDLRHGGTVPFLIDWGGTPPPHTTAPAGPELTSLTIEATDPDLARALVDALGLSGRVDVVAGDGSISPVF